MQRSAILFLPIINWEFRRQRPQQLARCFARSGDRVYYPFLRLHSDPPPPDLVESGICQIALRGNPVLDPYRDRLSGADVDEALASLRELAEDHPLDGCWIVAQLPFWRPLAEAARAAFRGRLLFDCMDDFASFGDHADSREEEVALARGADLVAVTAQALFDKLSPHNPRCRIIRNGCDPEHFGPALARQPPGGQPVVGFFGGIHDWFDAPLVEELARLRPGWRIWLVGDTYRSQVGSLRELPNVTFFGEVPYGELPRLVSFFDVGIIPFRITPLTEATNPIKVYEMLAAGLPVVATDLPELRQLQPLVSLASTASELLGKIERALAEPPAARRKRRELAVRNSWVERFLDLRDAMEEIADPIPRDSVSESGPPTLASLGIADLGGEKLDLRRRIDALQAARNEVEAKLRTAHLEGAELARSTADLEIQRISLIGQRDRVQAEAERLRGELARVEAERLRLERELQRVHTSYWGRIGARLRLLRSDRAT